MNIDPETARALAHLDKALDSLVRSLEKWERLMEGHPPLPDRGGPMDDVLQRMLKGQSNDHDT